MFLYNGLMMTFTGDLKLLSDNKHSQKSGSCVTENILNHLGVAPPGMLHVKFIGFDIPCGIGKAVPLQAWSGQEGSRKLRFPDFMTTAQEGGKVVSHTHRPHLRPGNSPGTHFC